MKVYCAIDFFFENWDELSQRKLWFVVLPYVRNATELNEWVETLSDDGSAAHYELIVPSTFTEGEKQEIIPVPLSLDTDLEVTLSTGQILSLNRTQNFVVTDPKGFRDLNTEKTLTPLDDNASTTAIVDVEPNVPYAVSLVKQIQQMYKSERDSLPIWLQLAFEIGQRRKFNSDVMSNLGPYMSVEHPSDPAVDTYDVTNLHSLAGLMLEMPTEVALLNQVNQVEVKFLVGGNAVATLPLAHDSDSTIGLTRFFSTIKERFAHPRSNLEWLPEIQRRVYALPVPQIFARQPLGEFDDFILYRRARGGKGTDELQADITLSQLERVVTRYNVDGDGLHPIAPQSISVSPVSTFDLVTQLFRGYPKLVPGDIEPHVGGEERKAPPELVPPDGYVMRITAQPHDLERWRQIVHQVYNGSLDTKFSGITLLAQSVDGNARVIKPDWVNVYQLPWEEEDEPVVLMYIREFVSGELLALVSDCLGFKFEMQLKGIDIDVDPFGPRWEYKHTPSVSDKKFDALLLEEDVSPLEDLRLIISAYTSDEFEFELAQSARRIEAVAKARFERMENTVGPVQVEPLNVDAEKDFQADYENHNSAFLVSNWESEIRLLNSASEATADHVELINGDTEYIYTFHMRYTNPTSARPGMEDVRGFYSDLYRRIGKERLLEFELEHTYGTRLDIGDSLSIQTPLDEHIRLPVDVGEKMGDAHVRFLVVTYDRPSEVEQIALRFNKKILTKSWVDVSDEPARKESHIEAWQAVAEFAYASKVEVVCQSYRFDFYTALNNRGGTLGSGLIPSRQAIEIDVTERLRTEASSWLDAADYPDDEFWDLPLSITGEPLWKDSHAIRFYIRLVRSPENYPHKNNDWEMVTPITELPDGDIEKLVDINGYKTNPVNSETAIDRFNQWTRNLQEAAAFITPDGFTKENRDDIERYRGLLHVGPQDSVVKSDAASWIVPKGGREPDGEATVTIVPVGFKPIERSTYLGDATDTQIMEFFLALQAAVNLESTWWAKTHNARKWATFFEGFDKKTASGSGVWQAYTDLCLAVGQLLHPVPSTLSPKSTEEPIHEHVVEVAQALKSETEISDAIRSRFKQNFQKMPGVFSTAKALVYQRITGSTVGVRAPADFFSLKQEKEISPLDDAGSDVGVTDIFSASFERGLLTNDPNWFGFLEILDNGLYDNEYHIIDMRLKSAEDLLEDRKPSLGIVNNEVFIPAKEPLNLDDSSSGKPIYLPSRKIVQKPVLVSNGIFLVTQSEEEFIKQFPMNEARDFYAFVDGVGKPPESDALPVKRLDSIMNRRTSAIDDVIMSYIFTIRGDEELDSSQWVNGLTNDTFYVRLSKVQEDLRVEEVPDVVSSVENSFLMLRQDPNFLHSKLLEELLTKDTLNFVTKTLAKHAEAVVEPQDAFIAFRIEESDGKPSIKLTKAPSNRGYAIHLFQVDGKGSEDLLYVWLTLELSIWQEQYASLQQARNLGNAERRFAPEFGMLSNQESSSYFPRQPLVHSLLDHLVVKLEMKDYSPKNWLETLFIEKTGLLKEIGADQNSPEYIVNISLYELIMPVFPVQKPGGSPSKARRDIGVFPVRLLSCKTKTDWAEPLPSSHWFSNGGRMRVDVEWRSIDTNDIVLRLEGLEVWKEV
ncbi:hypothetical protein GWZ48_004383 [Vibrio fluvialis]|nr:hypothetical protein [Vibrio fluvialis]